MATVRLRVDGADEVLEVEPEMPLLWALRDVLGRTGTKYGCGLGQCGACTVLVDGVATRSCQLAVADVHGEVTTIAGLATDGELHPVQRAWIDAQVPQCGYCQSGQVLAAVALLRQKPQPSDDDIDAAMTNLCRCGTYPRIRRAIHAAARSGLRAVRAQAIDAGALDAGPGADARDDLPRADASETAR